LGESYLPNIALRLSIDVGQMERAQPTRLTALIRLIGQKAQAL
jgi:hypothetical protein